MPVFWQDIVQDVLDILRGRRGLLSPPLPSLEEEPFVGTVSPPRSGFWQDLLDLLRGKRGLLVPPLPSLEEERVPRMASPLPMEFLYPPTLPSAPQPTPLPPVAPAGPKSPLAGGLYGFGGPLPPWQGVIDPTTGEILSQEPPPPPPVSVGIVPEVLGMAGTAAPPAPPAQVSPPAAAAVPAGGRPPSPEPGRFLGLTTGEWLALLSPLGTLGIGRPGSRVYPLAPLKELAQVMLAREEKARWATLANKIAPLFPEHVRPLVQAVVSQGQLPLSLIHAIPDPKAQETLKEAGRLWAEGNTKAARQMIIEALPRLTSTEAVALLRSMQQEIAAEELRQRGEEEAQRLEALIDQHRDLFTEMELLDLRTRIEEVRADPRRARGVWRGIDDLIKRRQAEEKIGIAKERVEAQAKAWEEQAKAREEQARLRRERLEFDKRKWETQKRHLEAITKRAEALAERAKRGEDLTKEERLQRSEARRTLGEQLSALRREYERLLRDHQSYSAQELGFKDEAEFKRVTKELKDRIESIIDTMRELEIQATTRLKVKPSSIRAMETKIGKPVEEWEPADLQKLSDAELEAYSRWRGW